MRRICARVQICYAERLGALYIVGANWFFWAIYKVLRPFLSDVTKSKIHIMGSPEELLEHFDAEQLEPSMLSGAG